ncbi:MAG TPA: sigma-70 region 4 domain-containing protein, partial [Solirubrobacteraceae bacterium]|nr:sigma-70 region 4 domain-containing protein [Solirubrobacteraceae bacterium]
MDELPPDQRAALSLVLLQHKSFADVAATLRISEGSVRARAHAALAVLDPAKARALSPEQRTRVGDYLLGQQGISERLQTRTFLAETPPARAWAAALAQALQPVSAEPLPEIPEPAAAPEEAAAPATSSAPEAAAPASAA